MPKPEPGNATAFGPAISAYTRAQAIEDGILVDVSETAREAGFKIPVAVTRTVWNRLVALPDGYQRLPGRARAPVGRPLDGAPLRAPRLEQRPRENVRAGARHPQGPPRQQPAAPQALPHRGDRRRRSKARPAITIMFAEDD